MTEQIVNARSNILVGYIEPSKGKSGLWRMVLFELTGIYAVFSPIRPRLVMQDFQLLRISITLREALNVQEFCLHLEQENNEREEDCVRLPHGRPFLSSL